MQGLKKIIQSNIQQSFGTFGGGGNAQGGNASAQQSPLFGGGAVPNLNSGNQPPGPGVGNRFNALI